MAYNFLGTINSIDDLAEFEEFVKVEVSNIGKRMTHLEQEKNRLGSLLDNFKAADLKLRASYKLSKTADADWVVNPRPREKVYVKSNDALTAIDVDLLKKGFLDTIKFKRERNEFKIKRIRDLIEQIGDEITMLQSRQGDYQNILSRVRGRFEFADFTELQKTDDPDTADVTPGVRAIPKGAGTEIINNVTYLNIVNINSTQKLITFSIHAPALNPGDTLTLSRGQNNGIKTFKEVKDAKSIIVYETLVDENPSQSLAIVNTES